MPASTLPTLPDASPEEIERYGQLLDPLGIALLIAPPDAPAHGNALGLALLSSEVHWQHSDRQPFAFADLLTTPEENATWQLELYDEHEQSHIWSVHELGCGRHRLITLSESSDSAARIPGSTLGTCAPAHFLTRLDEEIQRARRYGTPFSLAQLEVTGTVEAQLTRPLHLCVARLLAATLREIDLVCAQTPGVFRILLPNVRLSEALAGLERLRGIVESQPLSESLAFVRLSGSVVDYAGETRTAFLERAATLFDFARESGPGPFRLDNDLL